MQVDVTGLRWLLVASQQRRATESNGSPTTEPVNALCLVAQPPTRLRTVASPVVPEAILMRVSPRLSEVSAAYIPAVSWVLRPSTPKHGYFYRHQHD